MNLNTARILMPLAARRDWSTRRLTYFSRAAYGDASTWRSRLLARLGRLRF